MKDNTNQFDLSIALGEMTIVCRSLEAFEVEVISAKVTYYGKREVLVNSYKPLWDWAKLNELPVVTEPWDHPNDVYHFHTTVATNGILIEALMTDEEYKEGMEATA